MINALTWVLQGADFVFIRRSGLFDECSEQTGFKWNSQYVGGNKLAVCNGRISFTLSTIFAN